MTCSRQSPRGIGLLAMIAVLMLSGFSRSQGPVYRERWGYLHLEQLRAQVFDEMAGRPQEDIAKVASLLAAPDGGVPFRPVANALGFLREVEVDGAFLLRCSLGLFVLPEVVDADSTVATCRSANFPLYLPVVLPLPGAVSIEVIVRDHEGRQVWSKLLDGDIGVSGLRLSQVKASVPSAELPDGAYTVELRTMIDGDPPRDHDPVTRWAFHVMRGYQARAEKALAIAVTDRSDYAPLVRAQLDGLSTEVSRAFTGQAFAVRSDAVRELEMLEQCLTNLAEERAPLAGLTGRISTAMPVGQGDLVQPCTFRLPSDDSPHPMVVFASGSPAYDMGSRRPAAPLMRSSKWLSRELGDFGVDEGWHVVCCDSAGGGRPYAKALLATIQALPEVLKTGGQKPLLVCDRESAAVVALHLAKFQPHISGVVLCGVGAIAANTVGQLGDLPIRLVELAHYPASASIPRMLAFVDSLEQAGDQVPNISPLHDRAEPWLFGLSRSATELAAFASQVFGER